MKHTLNTIGQAAIVQFLENIGFKGRPWDYFARAETSFNVPRPFGSTGPTITARLGENLDERIERLTLEPDWFDTAVEPATFDDLRDFLQTLVDRMASLQPGFGMMDVSSYRAQALALLARCPPAVAEVSQSVKVR